ncbi:MAG TPA: signal peptidase I [Clostridia bacterium]|nr:signal peptidase I [Clostridia bacterium]HPK16991.1 signal peptidase I [Clostridia bacterium]
MKKLMKRMAIPMLCCVLTLTLFRVFFFLGYVPSSSMEPTIRQGSFILADRTAYWSSEPAVGDIIVFRHEGKVLVKRVMAIAGESVQTYNGTDIVPDGMLYLLGDNEEGSIDSRFWRDPFVPIENVIARCCE